MSQGERCKSAPILTYLDLRPTLISLLTYPYMPPLSKALQAALGGQAEMTAELMYEWAVKRPGEYRAHKIKVIQEALDEMEADKRR